MEPITKLTPETTDASGTLVRTVDHAASNAHKAIDKASDAARPVVEHMAAGAHQTVDKLADTATHVAETRDVKSGQLREAQTRFSESCRTHVRDNPMTALGIAVVAGLILSRLLS